MSVISYANGAGSSHTPVPVCREGKYEHRRDASVGRADPFEPGLHKITEEGKEKEGRCAGTNFGIHLILYSEPIKVLNQERKGHVVMLERNGNSVVVVVVLGVGKRSTWIDWLA